MTDNEVKIQLVAADNATKDIQKVTKSLGVIGVEAKNTGFKFTELKSALSLAKQAFGTVKQVIDETVGTFVTYANQVREMTQLTGASAEQSSRMIQIADDMEVSYNSLSKSLEAAVRKGIDPSVESIAKLSDEYLALEPGLKRSEFLMKTFGRAGMDMAKIMEQGGKAIKEQNSMVDAKLILDEKAIRKAVEFTKTEDDLDDAMNGLKITIGQRLIPKVSDLLVLFTKLVTLDPAKWFNNGADAAANFLNSFFGIKPTVEDVTKVIKEQIIPTQDLADSEAELKAALDATTAANTGLLGLTQSIQSENDTYGKSMDELQAKEKDLRAAFDLLIKQGWSPQSKAVQDATKAYDDNAQAMNDLVVAHNAAMAKIAYDLFITKLEADGFTDAEFEIALQAGITLGVLDEKTVAMAKAMDNTAKAAEGAKNKFYDIGTAINNLPSGKTITITTRYVNEYGERAVGAAPGRASGGPVTAKTPYLVGERGPEMFVPSSSGSIVPHNQTSGGIIFNYSPLISLATQAEAERVLLPIIRKAQRMAA